ncbi:hypothetical protein D9613_011282 [Agrocybe pediades]|uniref:Polynucleotide 5'-hydroxyl-kinase GRC3 n=1 Tax=Agrocybe pediades TaxID=84607 RepID=A0A8H4QRK4_9AGAR|nr:hypothetical protein D9613_011282 [Agrocybe pediades]
MLSAVAARKAALAASQASTPPEPTATAGSSSGSASGSNSTPQPKAKSKRKLSTQQARPDAKKPKKNKSQPKAKTASKPVSDDFKSQADVIVVDSEEDEDDSDSGMSILEDFDPLELAKSAAQIPVKRAWSPSQPVVDSSDEEDDQVGVVDISSILPNVRTATREVEDDRVLSTFKPEPGSNIFTLTKEESSKLGLADTATLVGLISTDTLCLLGACNLTVLRGSVTLCGTTLQPSTTSYPIYAPRSAPLPVIRVNPKSETSTFDLPEHLHQFHAVISLQELKTNVQGLSRICRSFEGVFEPSRWQRSSTESPFGISGLYLVRRLSKECHVFNLPPSWAEALDRVAVHRDNVLGGAYIVKGPKNSGKSTFARTLMNRLLQSYRRVAFLECDLGQSEFTPGGMVALNIISKPVFGPPFTHPILPKYAHYIGSTTPRSSPSHYLEAISALLQTYRLDIQTPDLDGTEDDDERIFDVIPIIVNTMGWSKGLGADLTQQIESMLEPTDIFDIHAPAREDWSVAPPPVPIGGQRNGYGAYHDYSTMEATTALVHTLDFVPSSSAAAGYTPSDHRALSIMSYFHARYPVDAVPNQWDEVAVQSWDVSRPLCAVPPYQVDCGVAFDKIVLAGAGSEDVVEEEIGNVLNGAIVGFVSCEPGTVDMEISGPESGSGISTTGIPYSRNSSPPSPASSNCVGIGLIRGVSSPTTTTSSSGESGPPKTYFHILTPLPHSLLENARVLVKGEMELPVWGMLDFRNFDDKEASGDIGDVAGVDRDNVPFLQWGKAPEGAYGAEKRRVRRNLMRRGQM